MMIDLNTVPLSALTNESRSLLSSRLNTRKVLPIIGPDHLSRHRDWRGLASLANISTEVAATLNDCQDKTAKVIDIWTKFKDGSDTVGRLLDYLQILDRYDVYEDLLVLAREEKLIVSRNQTNNNQVVVAVDGSDEDIITYDDKLFGQPQRYHAYVLYAKEDKDFVDELLIRMRSEGFKICTEEDLVAGHATQFQPVSRLISERCRYIVLIYSPDFLRSPAINFCMNLAQADAISKRQSKIIPVMYRQCVLPDHIAHYHSLRYSEPGPHSFYNFWERLSQSLRIVDTPRLNSASSTHSAMNIAELSQSLNNGYQKVNGYKEHQLALPSVPTDTSSMTDLYHLQVNYPNSYETKSLGNTSQTSEGKKKKSGPIRKIINTFRGKKHKKAIAVEN
ncbi:myeloid differentiation primary response protein MyD88 [Vanessa cardui]|uniref:myeloid differentiation primary response protein MyD88 n=1 Tax=Vanessa cardui TaxID=171605 RepID=UPI001F1384E0|nr:myeloid differentiation primary response protein MyD88 [Vanessa cardui]